MVHWSVIRALLFTSLLALGACGADPAPVELSVDLRTDYQGTVEFAGVRVEVLDTPGEVEHLARNASYIDGVRVAELGALEPRERRTLRLTLVGFEGEAFASREVLIDHRTDLAVTVTISRSCADVMCPGSAGDLRTSCLGGRCVEPACLTGEEAVCEEPVCAIDSECSATVDCAAGVCRAGTCLESDSGSCGADAYCDLTMGCVSTEPEPEPEQCAIPPMLDETFPLAPTLADRNPGESQIFGAEALFDDGEIVLVYVSDGHADGTARQLWTHRLRCDGSQTEPVPIDSPDVTNWQFVAGLRDGTMLVALDDEHLLQIDPSDGAVIDVSPLTTRDDDGVFDGGHRVTFLAAAGEGYLMGGTRVAADGSEEIFVQPLDTEGSPTGPAEVRARSTELGTRVLVEWVGGGQVVHSHEAGGERFVGTADGEARLELADAYFDSATGLDGEVWLAGTIRSTGEPAARLLSSLRGNELTFHSLDAPPGDSWDFRPVLVGGVERMLLIWTRTFGEPDVDGYDEVLQYSSVDSEAAVLDLAVIPTVGSSFTGPTDDRNEQVSVTSAVHVGADRFLIVWEEGWTRFHQFARFIQL